MRATPVFLLWVVFSGLAQGVIRYQKHFFVNLKKTWSEAQDYCRQKYGNLSTITSAEENTILNNAHNEVATGSWIGLRQDERGWYWSDGDTSDYRYWASEEPNGDSEHCGSIQRDTGRWNNLDCNSENTFFCCKWHRLVLVPVKMSWEEALLHCRKEYTDLARMLTKREADAADAMANRAGATRLWTSLRFLADEWLWVSERNQKFIQGTLPSCPAQRYSCGARRPSDGQWENRDCHEKLSFFCYRA